MRIFQDDANRIEDNEETGLPVFKTWPAVYLVVFATFVVWVLLLAALTGFFS